MNPAEVPEGQDAKRARVHRWLAYVLAVLAVIIWGVVPWALSLLTPRWGWAADRPGLWNLLGLAPVVLGTSGLFWTIVLHFAQPVRFEWRLAQNYLLLRGPYAFTRHPMYLSELTMMLGWVLFYGSPAVLAGFFVAWAWFNFGNMPLEERALEARFGEAYRDYKKRVPRWPGKTRS